MDTFLQDVRYALRTLARSRSFTIIAIACMAIGIGVNTTIFSVVNAILLRPFDFADPERLVVLQEQNTRNNYDSGVAWPNLVDWRTQSTVFSDIGAVAGRSFTLGNIDEPERLVGAAVTWNLFPLLGKKPALGRGIRREEDKPGAERVVLLSEGLWRRRFGADQGILGKTLTLNEIPHTVIGVMEVGFKFPEEAELWVPLREQEGNVSRDNKGLFAFARLGPGVTLAQARSGLSQVTARLTREYRENADWTGKVSTIREEFIPDDVRLIVLTMMGAVTFVLLIACANVANLMLARATGRSREIAIRSALGAGRRRIVTQLLIESIIIGLAGGILGIPLAAWGLRLLDSAIPAADALPYYIHWGIDQPTLLYTVIVSTLTGILFGLTPALQAAHGSLQEALRDGARGSGTGAKRSRFRNTLVVAEIALALVLLAERLESGTLVACDLYPEKLAALGEEARRLKLPEITGRAVDWSVGQGSLAAEFDRVLVDAPCSGTGTLRRRPEILRRLGPEDPVRLGVLAESILRSAASLAKPGASVVFAVCSVLSAECEALVERVGDILEPQPFVAPELPEELIAGKTSLRLLPGLHGTDGYFMASFRRR